MSCSNDDFFICYIFVLLFYLLLKPGFKMTIFFVNIARTSSCTIKVI